MTNQSTHTVTIVLTTEQLHDLLQWSIQHRDATGKDPWLNMCQAKPLPKSLSHSKLCID